MSIQELYSNEQLQEMSLIEITFDYLKNSKQPIAFNDLMNEISAALGLTDEEVRAKIAQFYTDLNIDGRFLTLGENRWGLRVWYPVDTQEEEVVSTVKPKKKKAKKVVDEDDADLDDFDDVEDDFDDYDEDDIDDFDEDDD
ncbi:MAG: DNA-directed RNA polymerase subunit delta, partial [Bacillota bacterium]|nr:DNA-directed RNA polymerase subunit delta [Bacillota bacterium]